MLGLRSKTHSGASKTQAPAGTEASARAAEIASDLVERATEVAQRAVEGAREAAPVVLSTAATAAETLGVAAERAAEKLSDTAERLAEPSRAVSDVGRERLADAADALAQAVRPRRRRGLRRAVVVGGVVGASVGLYVSPLGRKVREALGGGAPEEPPASIPLPTTPPAAAAAPTQPARAETAKQAQPAETGGDGVLAARQAGSSEPED